MKSDRPKQAELLENLAHGYRQSWTSIDKMRAEALEAAIELMRAAEPQDEAAEREHCKLAVFANHEGWRTGASSPWVELLMRERAAVRAHYEAMLAPKNGAAEREHCEGVARYLGAQQCLGVNIAGLIERERALARAEVEAKYAQLSDAFIALQNEHALLVAKTK
jgi:hypothetical protein